MDQITKSLQNYLTKNRIRFKSMFNRRRDCRLDDQTSTVFHINSELDNVKMSIVIDIYPKDKMVYLSVHPWDVFDNNKMDELKVFVNKWNNNSMFSTLSIEEEKGVIEPDRFCFQLTGRLLAEKEGLSFKLWENYLKLIVKETLHTRVKLFEIINPGSYE